MTFANIAERIRHFGTFYGKVTTKDDKPTLKIDQHNEKFNSAQFGNCVYYFIAPPDRVYKIGEATTFSSRKNTYQNGLKCRTTKKIYDLIKNNPDLDNAEVWMVQTPRVQVTIIDPLYPEEGPVPITVSTSNTIEQNHIQRAYNEGYVLEACNEVKNERVT